MRASQSNACFVSIRQVVACTIITLICHLSLDIMQRRINVTHIASRHFPWIKVSAYDSLVWLFGIACWCDSSYINSCKEQLCNEAIRRTSGMGNDTFTINGCRNPKLCWYFCCNAIKDFEVHYKKKLWAWSTNRLLQITKDAGALGGYRCPTTCRLTTSLMSGK